MAYRTVRPYALGKARQASAVCSRAERLYAYRGDPANWRAAAALSAVRKLDVVGMDEVVSSTVAMERLLVVAEARAAAEAAEAVGEKAEAGSGATRRTAAQAVKAAAIESFILRLLELLNE